VAGFVDEAAFIQALQGGVIAGTGLDVFTYEPLSADSRFARWGT
jgi:phosphoglycerate dehydrogenase-like enzyme